MIVLISIDKDYNNYSEFSETLQSIQNRQDFSEFCCIENSMCDRYREEYKAPMEKFKINWGDLSGLKRSDIKSNKWGKEYNSRAPAIAAEKVCAYATHIIEFGKGDYSISQALKDFNLIKITAQKQIGSTSKRYNF